MTPMIAIAFLMAGGLAVIVMVLVGQRNDRTLAGRVELLKNTPTQRPQVDPEEVPRWQDRALAMVQSVFAYRMRRTWGLSNRPVTLLVVGIVSAIAFWLFNRLALHVPGSIGWVVTVVVFFLIPRFVLMREQHRADAQFSELLPDAIDMVVRIVRAGMPVGAAVRTVAQEASPPINGVFGRVADQSAIGMPFDEALTRISAQIGNTDFRFFAVAVALQQMTGGNLTATLETLSTIIRRRRAVILKAHAASAEVRMSALILGAIPFFVGGALALLAPTYLNALFNDPRGNVILGVALFLILAAALTMRTMIRNALAV